MAGADWAVLAAGLGGTVLGSALQWAQAAVQARRDRKREQQGWSREDGRLWAEKRQTIYLETIASARRQFMALEGGAYPYSNLLGGERVKSEPVTPVMRARMPPPRTAWKRTQEMRADWNRLLAEVEFYGSDEVRAAVAQLELAFDMVEEFTAYDPRTAPAAANFIEDLYMDCITKMRCDLGLSSGGRVDLMAARGKIFDRLVTHFLPDEGLGEDPPASPDPDRTSVR